MENKQYFDPYNFNNILTSPNTTNNSNGQNYDMSFTQIAGPSPTMFYEQQFWYYNYLTKMLEYKMKLKEYENMNKNKSN